MKLTTGILILGMAATAWGQNPDAIQDARDTMKSVQQKKTNDSNAALGIQGTTSQGASAQGSSRGTAASGTQRTARIPQVAYARGSASKAKAKAKAKVATADKTHLRRQTVAVESGNTSTPNGPEKPKTISLTDRRDPFVSPVVNRSVAGSGCSVGKRCLAVDQIALKGVVKSDGGMIAVVVNALDKAYFLRENDPVFNGYVVRITGDSIVFKETVQDRLGKPMVREVTKKITTPAV